MKRTKMLALALLVTPIYMANARHNNRLTDALERSNVAEFKKQLNRAQPLSKKDQKVLLEEAEDTVDQRKANMSIFKSFWDATNTIAGFAGIGIGLTGLYVGSEVTESRARPYYIAGGFLTIVGLWKLYKGLSCAWSKKLLADAQAIEKAVENAEIEELHTSGKSIANVV